MTPINPLPAEMMLAQLIEERQADLKESRALRKDITSLTDSVKQLTTVVSAQTTESIQCRTEMAAVTALGKSYLDRAEKHEAREEAWLIRFWDTSKGPIAAILLIITTAIATYCGVTPNADASHAQETPAIEDSTPAP